jgi:plasmid stabilization system protein ParE
MLNIVRGSQPASMDVLPRYLSHTRDGVAALSADPIAAFSRSALPGARLMGAGGPSSISDNASRHAKAIRQNSLHGWTEPEDVFEAVFARYRLADGGIERAAAVLACLKDFWDNGVRTGRSGLLDELTRRGTRLSVHRLRTCLRRLAEDGFVLIGATRQGSAITPDGLHFLERIAPR